MFNVNGPPRGQNVTADQSSYDIIYKDIIVKSENRNTDIFPNPNTYTVTLNEAFDKIYKAEIISVNIPAATDIAVNLTSQTNCLYFQYDISGNLDPNYGYIKVQAGTYVSPTYLANELQRQFNILTTDIIASYNSNLNRYIFVVPIGNTLTLFPINGTVCGPYTVENSIATSLNLYTDPALNVTQPINIVDNVYGTLQVINSDNYGSYNGVTNTIDSQFGNSIASNLVLTNCNIYLSMGKLNSNTIQFVANQNPELPSNIASIFCEVPNNTLISSASVKTLLGQPSVWSSENFYNPPLADLRKLEISWYNEIGNKIDINEHCFTLRIYYLQKRNQTTALSVPFFTYTGTGTLDSIFQPRNS